MMLPGNEPDAFVRGMCFETPRRGSGNTFRGRPIFLALAWKRSEPARSIFPMKMPEGDAKPVEAASFAETVAFDDPDLAGTLFGPLGSHLELLADVSGVKMNTRGTELTVSSPDPALRELMLNLFTQAYGLLKGGHTLRGEDLLQGFEVLSRDARADIGELFREAGVIVASRRTVLARNRSQRIYVDLLRQH
jgi:phosphate starvation-inducible protein PhoH